MIIPPDYKQALIALTASDIIDLFQIWDDGREGDSGVDSAPL